MSRSQRRVVQVLSDSDSSDSLNFSSDSDPLDSNTSIPYLEPHTYSSDSSSSDSESSDSDIEEFDSWDQFRKGRIYYGNKVYFESLGKLVPISIDPTRKDLITAVRHHSSGPSARPVVYNDNILRRRLAKSKKENKAGQTVYKLSNKK